MTECKLLKIIGHDGSDHHIKACPFECSQTNMNDPRPIGLAFFISKATKGTAHIEMKMSVENEKKQKTIVLHKNSRCTKSPLCYDPLLDIIDGYYVRYWDWNVPHGTQTLNLFAKKLANKLANNFFGYFYFSD